MYSGGRTGYTRVAEDRGSFRWCKSTRERERMSQRESERESERARAREQESKTHVLVKRVMF